MMTAKGVGGRVWSRVDAWCVAIVLAGATTGFACQPQPERSSTTQEPAAEDGLPAVLGQGTSSIDPDAASRLEVKRVKTGHMLVRPKINGHEAGWFIFDTGAGVCVVDPKMVTPLSLEKSGSVDAVGVGGEQRAATYRARTVQLGPITLQDHPVMTTDLSFLTPFLGEEISGVIGYGVLSRCIAEIDIEGETISIFDPATYVLQDAQWSPMSLDGRIPSIEAQFEGHRGRFKLDTGSNSGVTFHAPSVTKWSLLEGREVAEAKLGGVGGFVAAKRGSVRDFVFGDVRRDEVKADFAIEAKGNYADASRDGNIGAGLLRHFLITLDYAGERIALRERVESPQAVEASPDARPQP